MSRKVIKLLLDEFPNAAAAYSLRLLNSQYTGNCIEVRRSSDNTTQNIGFVNGVLDTASLLSFVGAGDGFVRTWYDQSGNGRNAFNNDNLRQPLIIISGNINLLNNIICISNTVQNFCNNLFVNLNLNINPPITVIFSGNIESLGINGANNYSTFFGANTNSIPSGRYELVANNNGFSAVRANSPTPNVSSLIKSPYDSNIFVTQVFYRGTQINTRYNFSDSISTNYFGTEVIRGNQITIINGSANNDAISPKTNAYEYIIYLSDQHANRIGIEQNINAYYNIF